MTLFPLLPHPVLIRIWSTRETKGGRPISSKLAILSIELGPYYSHLSRSVMGIWNTSVHVHTSPNKRTPTSEVVETQTKNRRGT